MPITLASDKCNCSTGTNTAIEDHTPGKSQTFPENGSVSINTLDTPPQRQYSNNANSGSSPNLTSLHPLMHPTEEQMNKWMGEYKAAPRAYLNPQVRSTLSMLSGAHLSLLDYLKYTPSERNQGHCGNCWAWAGTGVMEIDRAYQTGSKDRLSIQYLDSNYLGNNNNCLACCGGWLNNFADFYSTTKIAVPWSNTNAAWQDGDKSCEDGTTNVPASTISTNPHYNITSIDAVTIPAQGVGKETAIANIKNVLSQGKAIWFGFFLPDNSAWNNFFSFWDSQTETSVWKPDLACGEAYNYNQGGGHAVLCVGYDDTDPQNRYWIMLNSWCSSSNRPNGLFLMNMDMNYDCSYAGLGYAFYWMTLNIDYANNPPGVPSIPSGPSSGYIGASYTYSTSAVDSNGYQVKYTFDWGDGTNSTTNLVNSGTSATLSHTWNSVGTYQVKAKAMDNSSASSVWSNPLAVTIAANAPPNAPAKPSGLISGIIGHVYSYSTFATDPNGNQVKYVFDWGDGTTSATSFVNSGASASTFHAWNDLGSYQVRADATDNRGASSGWSSPLAVTIAANTPPNRPIKPVGPSIGRKQVAYTYSTYARDPNGDHVKYTFDWGDGTTSITGFVSTGTNVSVPHSWNALGSYKVRVNAADSMEASSGWSDTLTVTITSNTPPDVPIKPSGSGSSIIGSICSYSTLAMDPDGNQVKYTFDWGDGTTSSTSLVNSGTSASASHAWSASGLYQVRANATDSSGASSGWSSPLAVTISANTQPNKPIIPVGHNSGLKETAYKYITYAKDLDGDQVKYTFDWGDGSTSVTSLANSGKSLSSSHKWRSAGKYLVKAMATDSRDANSGWSNPRVVRIL